MCFSYLFDVACVCQSKSLFSNIYSLPFFSSSSRDAVVDECLIGAHNCDANAECTDLMYGFECSCHDGFSGNGTECTDIDECDLGVHNCSALAVCENMPGSYNCTCLSGYSGDGLFCTDIDECTLGIHNCDSSAICVNDDGGFSCSCPRRYLLVNGTGCEVESFEFSYRFGYELFGHTESGGLLGMSSGGATNSFDGVYTCPDKAGYDPIVNTEAVVSVVGDVFMFRALSSVNSSEPIIIQRMSMTDFACEDVYFVERSVMLNVLSLHIAYQNGSSYWIVGLGSYYTGEVGIVFVAMDNSQPTGEEYIAGTTGLPAGDVLLNAIAVDHDAGRMVFAQVEGDSTIIYSVSMDDMTFTSDSSYSDEEVFTLFHLDRGLCALCVSDDGHIESKCQDEGVMNGTNSVVDLEGRELVVFGSAFSPVLLTDSENSTSSFTQLLSDETGDQYTYTLLMDGAHMYSNRLQVYDVATTTSPILQLFYACKFCFVLCLWLPVCMIF